MSISEYEAGRLAGSTGVHTPSPRATATSPRQRIRDRAQYQAGKAAARAAGYAASYYATRGLARGLTTRTAVRGGATAEIGLGGRGRNIQPIRPSFRGSKDVTLTLEGLELLPQLIQQELMDAYLYELLLAIREKTPVDTGRAREGWEIVGDTIANPVEYVKYLELGTDRTRPIGMVSRTLAQSQQILDLVAARILQNI